ncbi:MAG: PGN_0703 family putative restriction endonuclease [Dermatophilaceae bacterium]
MLNEATLRAHQAFHTWDRNPWQQRARLMQSLWRQERGLAPGGGQSHDGSSVADPDRQGVAFLSTQARDAVRRSLTQPHPGSTTNTAHWYSNLLLSQSLSFNLFGPLADQIYDDETTHALRAVWPDIAQVTDIAFDYSPGRRWSIASGLDTRHDVHVSYIDQAGAKRFLGVKVTYVEDLAGTRPELHPRARNLMARSEVFADDSDGYLGHGRAGQLLRDHLLVLGANDSGDATGRFVVLHPTSNAAMSAHVDQYRRQLADDATFESRTLEEVVAAFRHTLGASWVDDFDRRYLDGTALADLDSAD